MSAVDNEAPATAGAALAQRETGSVKWYHSLKQYGFIKPDRIGAGGPSADGIFMHTSGLTDPAVPPLQPGRESEL